MCVEGGGGGVTGHHMYEYIIICCKISCNWYFTSEKEESDLIIVKLNV